jgi:hypothetical protein
VTSVRYGKGLVCKQPSFLCFPGASLKAGHVERAGPQRLPVGPQPLALLDMRSWARTPPSSLRPMKNSRPAW